MNFMELIMPLKIITFIYLFFATILVANDAKGKELFNDADCMSCHVKNDFAKRKDKVNNFTRLHKTVTACQFNNDVGWFDDETLDVSEYLNKKYYKFHTTD